MEKVVRKLAVCCLLLFAFAGRVMAQDAPFVIKWNDHYLSHVYNGNTWVLKDKTTFHPDSCLWYSGPEFNSSGTNHNYYFFDGNNYRFLAAPLEASGALSISASTPYTYHLRNVDTIYYFYDWDWDNYPIDGAGVARGHQYYELDSTQCVACQNYTWEDGQCWEVYWAVYNAEVDNWRMSDTDSYTITDNAGRFRSVAIDQYKKNPSGGLTALNDLVMQYPSNATPSATIAFPYSYLDSTVYTFENIKHPIMTQRSFAQNKASYQWSISGEGAAYLSFDASGSHAQTSTTPTPTLYYDTENTTGDKTATLTLTVTYYNAYNDYTSQTLSATVTVKTKCQNPGVMSPNITNEVVTVRWYNTNADSYTLYWRKNGTNTWNEIYGLTTTSYPLNGLDYNTQYDYKVKASCDENDPSEHHFTTKPEPALIVYGAVYGGGRMADVGGKTEVAVINCDSLGAIYGGNDIAGAVLNTAGSKIILGVNAGDNSFAAYANSDDVKHTKDTILIGSVYGGGNGYYIYQVGSHIDDSLHNTFIPAINDSIILRPNDSIVNMATMLPEWTNPSTTDNDTLFMPTLVKAEIKVTNNYIKVDSLFGGAKNAFLTHITGYQPNGDTIFARVGDTITIDGGTLFAVFGGNNVGGSQGKGVHSIVVNQTTIDTSGMQSNATKGSGINYGIRYLFGGGNKVRGSATDIHIYGGQCDTVFGGGNMADVDSAFMWVNCAGAAANGSQYVFGKIYSNGITSFNDDVLTIKEEDYPFDGTGIYNIHTLFGGNNKAAMYGVPHIYLTSGAIGTAYGGGNAGDMMASKYDSIYYQPDQRWFPFHYGTKIQVNSPSVLVDYLYGGCQVSNVDYSTWVDIQNGHIGSVYGGCNVSGDVGSTRINPDAPGPKGAEYQAVKGGTYVKATGGTVYHDFFAGSNGFYHCNDGTKYIEGIDYADSEHQYIGMLIPSHNETYLFISKTTDTCVLIKGDVYAGANLACVGFTNFTRPRDPVTNQKLPYPEFVGLSSLRMDGGRVEGSVYGGGRMASVFGSNEVKVAGGYIGGSLYGGNDRTGQVAQITNRVWTGPDNYTVASDQYTSLERVHTYVGLTGTPHINTVYGGGNGAYDYENGDMEYCLLNDQPIQSNTFVDINIDNDGHVNTVFGGGNGVTVTGGIQVFLNVHEPVAGKEHVGTIFGGNNLGTLDILSDIILLHGQVQNVYGGCNKGSMTGSQTVTSADGSTTYNNVGSFVRLRDTYTTKVNGVVTDVNPDAVVSGAVYGGCRMNFVTNNSLVLVEGGRHTDTTMIFGGCDISGDVRGTQTSTSKVVVTNGTGQNNATLIGDVFGGGNGGYYYRGNKVYSDASCQPQYLIDTLAGVDTIQAPFCRNAFVEMQGGTATNLYGGGLAGPCGETGVLVEGGTVTQSIYGGGMQAGTEKTHNVYGNNSVTEIGGLSGNSTVTVDGICAVGTGIYGGCNISGNIEGNVNVIIHDTVGTSAQHLADGIYGGGFGVETGTKGNVTVTVDKKEGNTQAPAIYSDVYGGSAFGTVNDPHAQAAAGLTKIDFNDGTLFGNLFGGGKGGSEPGPSDSTLVYGNVMVNLNGGSIRENIYGGCNQKGSVVSNIAVNILGGSVGSIENNSCATADVFGGGFGSQTTTSGNVVVTIDTIPNSTNPAPIIYGDVYGGSGYGDVNENANDSTIVNVLNGTIAKISCDGGTTYFGGSVYGGGLGSAQYPAKVNGKVFVNIGALTGPLDDYGFAPSTSLSGNATIQGEVYGCNNVNGTPLDSVFVNIYKTAHVTTPKNNFYPELPSGSDTWTLDLLAQNEPDQGYALKAVYGGGNKASYTATSAGEPMCTTVHVWGCEENTIDYVYGGGNAANIGDTLSDGTVSVVANSRLIIDGGRINYSFGGGNGAGDDNPGASIFGMATSQIHAGLINQVYGGANMKGTINVIDLNVLGDANCNQVYGKVFGCANAADINHSITTNMGTATGCRDFPVGELYGGSNQAYIGNGEDNTDASVTLRVYGGHYESVFGGSKGVEGTPAPIYGKVYLYLHGGTIKAAYGGTDFDGNIYDSIMVVVDSINTACPLVLDTVFGAGRTTIYKPNKKSNDELITSPIVYVKNGTVRRAVYGGGKGETATTTANPYIIIGDTTAANASNPAKLAQVGTYNGETYDGGYVFGGGFAGIVKGGPTVNVGKSNTKIMNSVFGGGDMASIDSTLTTVVNIYDGTVRTGIYGGCNAEGTVKDSIAVNIYGGVLGTAETKMAEGIFGGGKGNQTKTDDNIFVNIEIKNTDTVFADVYGGSAFGEVGATGTLAKVEVKSGSTVKGKIFGGGKGSGADNGNYSATVSGHTELAIEGTVLDSIFGGCNVHGVVEGNTLVCVTGSGRLGSASPAILANAYGGGLGQYTKVKGNVLDSINGNAVNIYGDVYGGSAMGLVNCNDAGSAQNGYAKTDVTLTNGTIYGSLYGGGLGQKDSTNPENDIKAKVFGPVTVTVEGGRVTNVFGCNNQAGAPQDTVIVNVTAGVMDSIFGGGNVAKYTAPTPSGSVLYSPKVHIQGGDVKYKVAGGGNAADVKGNPYVLVSNNSTTIPTIGTSIENDNLDKGIYGGCNTSGTVTGNVLVELEGGIIGIEGDGTNVRNKKANIHGGGYGKDTDVHGNVTVNFGKIDSDDPLIHTETPKLYGDLYGGSAFGDVNEDANNTTTVNLLNGSIESYHGRKQLVDQDSVIFGKAFGGGLGSKVGDIQAKVYGTVQVNVGYADNPDDLDTYVGQANLVECEVYGCNNQNGSPQQEVFVDVYQTKHIPSDSVHNTGGLSYAIYQVFGGGNESNFTDPHKNVDVYVHKCENTAWRVFGAGNAADVYGVRIKIDGGRFDWVFGGGNGERGPEYAANIQDSIVLLTGGGYITNLVGGSNLNGTAGSIREGTYPGCSETEIYNYFLGSNSDTIVGNIDATINCEPENAMSYVNLYCGSNLAPIYGNVNVTISGGRFDNVFGGSKGSFNNPSNPHGFETYASNIHDNEDTEEIEGHVNLLIKGGAIGNLYGACDENGNVDGKITITVHDECSECGFYIGNIYGGGNNTKYQPVNIDNGSGSTYSPEIKIIKGEIGGWTNKLPVHNPNHIADTTYAGNVYGGGNNDSVVCNRTTIVGPKVIVGDGSNNTPVTIKGNVFGGGNNGDVVGSPVVVVEPLTHNLTVETPTNGTIQVTNRISQPLSGDIVVGEGLDVNIKAVPAAGYRFTGWSVTEGNGHIMKPNEASTIFTMGTQNTKIKATFEQQ